MLPTHLFRERTARKVGTAASGFGTQFAVGVQTVFRKRGDERTRIGVARGGQYVRRAAAFHRFAVQHHRDFVRAFRDGNVVRDDDDRGGREESVEFVQKFRRSRGVYAFRRFVRYQQPHVLGTGGGKRHPLRLSARKFEGIAGEDVFAFRKPRAAQTGARLAPAVPAFRALFFRVS